MKEIKDNINELLSLRTSSTAESLQTELSDWSPRSSLVSDSTLDVLLLLGLMEVKESAFKLLECIS